MQFIDEGGFRNHLACAEFAGVRPIVCMEGGETKEEARNRRERGQSGVPPKTLTMSYECVKSLKCEW